MRDFWQLLLIMAGVYLILVTGTKSSARGGKFNPFQCCLTFTHFRWCTDSYNVSNHFVLIFSLAKKEKCTTNAYWKERTEEEFVIFLKVAILYLLASHWLHLFVLSPLCLFKCFPQGARYRDQFIPPSHQRRKHHSDHSQWKAQLITALCANLRPVLLM